MRGFAVLLLSITLLITPIIAQTTINPGVAVNSFSAAAVAVGNGTAFTLPQGFAYTLTWQTSFAVAPASITVLLQGSLDGTNYFTLDTSTNVNGEIRTLSPIAAQFVRARISAASGGSGITVRLNILRFQASSSAPLAITSGGTSASLSDPNADRILFWDDSAGGTRFLTAGTGLTITDTTLSAAAGGNLSYVFCSTSGNPGDSNNYIIGPNCSYVTTTTQGSGEPNYVIAPVAGTITQVRGVIHVATVLGSNESFNVSVRINNTTDTLISAVMADATINPFSNTGLSIAVAAGDTIQLKYATPAWVTNPTGVRFTAPI